MSQHILRTYDDELMEVRSVVVRMGGLAAEQLAEAMQALKELDADLAEKTRQGDKELDALEALAETTVVGVFARRAPVADDLREVVSALKMTTMIERMGDYAKNIARRSMSIAEGQGVILMPHLLEEMAAEAHEMIHEVMDCYVKRAADDAIAVWERDEQLDNMYNAAYRQILARMMEAPEQIAVLSHYLMIAKNLERIGDQATNVAEQVYYAITGEILEEARQKRGGARSDLLGD